MNEEKKEFVEALSDTLKMDSRSGVKSIQYSTGVWFEDILYEEVVQINYESGSGRYALINVIGNSNGANATEIIHEVYGSGAVGHISYGFKEKECDWNGREKNNE